LRELGMVVIDDDACRMRASPTLHAGHAWSGDDGLKITDMLMTTNLIEDNFWYDIGVLHIRVHTLNMQYYQITDVINLNFDESCAGIEFSGHAGSAAILRLQLEVIIVTAHAFWTCK
jgi:hypothetical protein